jgi:hypothetical protein
MEDARVFSTFFDEQIYAVRVQGPGTTKPGWPLTKCT